MNGTSEPKPEDPKPNNEGLSPLHIAVKSGHTKVIDALLQKGANINQKSPTNGITPLFLAALQNNSEMVTFLLDKGADDQIEENRGYNPIHIASELGHVEVLEAFATFGSNLNCQTLQHGLKI